MKAVSWLFRRLTQNEFRAITDQINSDGGGSQTYIDLPKGKISDADLNSFFGPGDHFGSGYKWEVPVHSLSLDLPPQTVVISQRRDTTNCIREQNKDKRINIWKSEYSDFPRSDYNESARPLYVFILKTDSGDFYAGWFYPDDYTAEWLITPDLCYPFAGESAGYAAFREPVNIDIDRYLWPFVRHPSPDRKNTRTALQQIFFGAPGVGKSHNLRTVYGNEDDVIRITFHPETDYASFVGCYKPVKKEMTPLITGADELIEKAKTITGVSAQVDFIFENAESILPAVKEKNLISANKLIVDFFGWNNETYFKSILTSLLKEREEYRNNGEITYEFTPQAFVNAYVLAWSDMRRPVYLVIEEINRGNCAQIFGDIFQLLDRDSDGYSTYRTTPDSDLQQYLRKAFSTVGIADADIRTGRRMQLPPNLHILATMNTSDQSLFPIDSAFKRRWEWVYMPIETKPEDANGETVKRTIETDAYRYDWGNFLEEVNKQIFGITRSEDKQLGFWFVKPRNGSRTITANDFVSKVIFYLWNDVYKDFSEDGTSVFYFSADGNPDSTHKEQHSFKDFTPRFKMVDNALVDAFIKNLGVTPEVRSDSKKTVGSENTTGVEDNEDSN